MYVTHTHTIYTHVIYIYIYIHIHILYLSIQEGGSVESTSTPANYGEKKELPQVLPAPPPSYRGSGDVVVAVTW
jgi:hypothetical protein